MQAAETFSVGDILQCFGVTVTSTWMQASQTWRNDCLTAEGSSQEIQSWSGGPALASVLMNEPPPRPPVDSSLPNSAM